MVLIVLGALLTKVVFNQGPNVLVKSSLYGTDF